MTEPATPSESNRDALLADYQALTDAAGVVDCGDFAQIEMTGADGVAFLHNMCSADIRSLAPGAGCEAFITSAQGKTLGFVFVFRDSQRLTLLTAPGQAETLIAHLDRYLIREDVQLTDRSADWANLLISGARARQALAACSHIAPPSEPLAHFATTIADRSAEIARFDFGRTPAWWIVSHRDAQETILAELLFHGAAPCGRAAFESLRVEAGLPLFGIDLGPDNLPQEIGRDATAISFTKGCYIGQETVARLDALGHVNKQLAGVRFAADKVPPAGAEFFTSESDKPVGRVTSAAWSPKLSAPLALAYLRRESLAVGTRLSSAQGDATVVTLPV